jgi:hypothetical protein
MCEGFISKPPINIHVIIFRHIGNFTYSFLPSPSSDMSSPSDILILILMFQVFNEKLWFNSFNCKLHKRNVPSVQAMF